MIYKIWSYTFLTFFRTIKYECLVFLTFLLLVFLYLIVYVLLFRFLFFTTCSWTYSRCTLTNCHALGYYCTETYALVCSCYGLIIFIVFVWLLFIRCRELILTQQPFKFSLIRRIRIFRRASIITIIRSWRLHSFRHFIILNLQILLPIILFFINILNRTFFLKICMNNSIILIKIIFFLFLF